VTNAGVAEITPASKAVNIQKAWAGGRAFTFADQRLRHH
jgi:hypothetical protein